MEGSVENEQRYIERSIEMGRGCRWRRIVRSDPQRAKVKVADSGYSVRSLLAFVVSSGWSYFEGILVRDRSSPLMYDVTLVGPIDFWSLVVDVFKCGH